MIGFRLHAVRSVIRQAAKKREEISPEGLAELLLELCEALETLDCEVERLAAEHKAVHRG